MPTAETQREHEKFMRSLFPDHYCERDEAEQRLLIELGFSSKSVTPEIKEQLRRAGYSVRQTDMGWYPVAPLGQAVLRGWTKSEDEAWWHCWQHSLRSK